MFLLHALRNVTLILLLLFTETIMTDAILCNNVLLTIADSHTPYYIDNNIYTKLRVHASTHTYIYTQTILSSSNNLLSPLSLLYITHTRHLMKKFSNNDTVYRTINQ